MTENFEPETDSVQALIDALSIALRRSVLLDDPALSPLAFSRQWDVDDVRSESILGRGVPPRVREELFAQGIESAEDLVHTAPDPELGMEERNCMPVRHGGEVLGYIWLLGPEATLGESDRDRVRQAAREIAELLASRPHREVPNEADLLAALRSPETEAREAAAAEAQERGLLPEDRLALCLIAAREGGGDALAAARQVVRRLSVGHAIAAGASEGAAVLAGLGDPVLRLLPSGEVGLWVHAAIGGGFAVGQSDVASLHSLDKASRQARTALRLARHRPPAEAAVAWESLGADRLIAQLPPAAIGDVPAPLLQLLASEPALAETLAVFLDVGGDVKAAADALSLHRSGLYYRLRRIEELSGLDLARGDDRLLAHIAIRIHKLGDL